MKLNDLSEIRTLRDELLAARCVLAAFEQVSGDTVATYANSGQRSDYGRRGMAVALPPVPKEVAVSAAKRQVEKVIDQLRNLGVTDFEIAPGSD